MQELDLWNTVLWFCHFIQYLSRCYECHCHFISVHCKIVCIAGWCQDCLPFKKHLFISYRPDKNIKDNTAMSKSDNQCNVNHGSKCSTHKFINPANKFTGSKGSVFITHYSTERVVLSFLWETQSVDHFIKYDRTIRMKDFSIPLARNFNSDGYNINHISVCIASCHWSNEVR